MSAKSENSIIDLGVLFSDLALQISSNFTILQLWKLVLKTIPLTAVWLTHLGERRSAEREVAGSNSGRTNTQGL